MKKKSSSQSAFLGRRVFIGLFIALAGVFLALLGAGAFSSATAHGTAVNANMTTIFGPTQYTRTGGPPQTFTATFQHCGTAPCQLVVLNGTADGRNRVSSAS